MTLYSSPTLKILQHDAESLSGKGFRADEKSGILFINLKENTYTFRSENIDSPHAHLPGGLIIEIFFNRKIFKPPVFSSGFLDDRSLVKTAWLLDTAKKSMGPGRLTEGLFAEFQLHLKTAKHPSVIHYREIEAVIHWVEAFEGKEAEEPGLSRSRRDRICRLLYSGSPSRIRRQNKMAAAYRQVLTTDDSLLAIALRTGFRNRPYFITAFKKFFALTPGALRANYRTRGPGGGKLPA